jgi:hypothetical protein
VPQLCNWVELLHCMVLEMVVRVVEWRCEIEMEMDGIVVG